MSDIPNELFHEILSYLPAEPLLLFRSVSKSWHSLIDDPGFIKLQLNRQKNNQQLILKKNWYGTWLYTLPLKSLNCLEECSKTIEGTSFKILSHLGMPYVCQLPMASCDGLVLFTHHESVDKIWALWNPFTRELLELPPPCYDNVTEATWDWLLFGLCYDVVTDDYKVVKLAKVFYDESVSLETSIFSVKLACWRRIDDFPNCARLYNIDESNRTGVFVDGAFYWIINGELDGVAKEWVLTFDLGSETYSLLAMPLAIPEPEPVHRPYVERCHLKHLDVIGGSLFISCFSYTGRRFDVWMMKDYGEKRHWDKLFSLTNVGRPCRPIAYLQKKKQVLFQYKDEFVWFNVEKKSAKKLSIKGLPDKVSSQALPASLVRLNNSARAVKVNGSEGTTGRKRTRDHERLELTSTVTDFQLTLADC